MAPTVSTLAFMALANVAIAQTTTNTWLVSYWESTMCTGLGLGETSGPDTPQLSTVCNAIPDIGTAASMTYEVASGNYTYSLGVHNTDDCSDDLGVFQGTCVNLIAHSRRDIDAAALQGFQTSRPASL